MSDIFPYYCFEGDAAARGLAHGEQLADRIHKLWDFYSKFVFTLNDLKVDAIRARAEEFREATAAYDADLVTELDHVAEGSGLQTWEIFALNGRSEVMNLTAAAECTSLFVGEPPMLCQTWDWIEDIESLSVIAHHKCENGLEILTLTEAGMLAKAGINSHGLGLCLNFISSPITTIGVPVHIVCRAILSAASVAQAEARCLTSGLGKSSHFLIGDSSGQNTGIEYVSDSVHTAPSHSDALRLHTNHCLAQDGLGNVVPTSKERLDFAEKATSEWGKADVERIRTLLLDQTQGVDSIQRPYSPEPALGGLSVGTCATLLMNLEERTLDVKRSPDVAASFERYELN